MELRQISLNQSYPLCYFLVGVLKSEGGPQYTQSLIQLSKLHQLVRIYMVRILKKMTIDRLFIFVFSLIMKKYKTSFQFFQKFGNNTGYLNAYSLICVNSMIIISVIRLLHHIAMKPFKPEETLSPWQIQNDTVYYQFFTELDKDSRKDAFTTSVSASRYASLPLQKSEKEKRIILNAAKNNPGGLKSWGSASLLRNKNKTINQRPASSNLKIQLRKYLIQEEQSSKKEDNQNKVSFTPLNFSNTQSFCSVRRGTGSARPLRGKKMQKIQVKGIKLSQKKAERPMEQEIDLCEKMSELVKQVSKQCNSDTMRLNLNRFINNYTKEQIKLTPLCIKLKLNK